MLYFETQNLWQVFNNNVQIKKEIVLKVSVYAAKLSNTVAFTMVLFQIEANVYRRKDCTFIIHIYFYPSPLSLENYQTFEQ